MQKWGVQNCRKEVFFCMIFNAFLNKEPVHHHACYQNDSADGLEIGNQD